MLRARGLQLGEAWQPLNQRFDVLLFFACALTYAGTLLWTVALCRCHWIGSTIAFAWGGLTGLALVFLMLRGLAFPDPNASAEPWYFQPGFIAGIPAMPWLVPHWLGVTLWQRAALGFNSEVEGGDKGVRPL